MQWNRPAQTTFVLVAGFAMAAVALAGCMTDGDAMSCDSFEETKGGPGQTYEPTDESQGDRIMLKLIKPENPDNAEPGEQPFTILLYEKGTDAPVADADVDHESFAPEMGHGGGDEQDAAHVGCGVYLGTIHPSMEGDWVVNVDVVPEDGQTHQYQIEYQA